MSENASGIATHGLPSARLLCPWDFPDKNTGAGFHFLLYRIFPAQGLNLCLLHCQSDSLLAKPLEKPVRSMNQVKLDVVKEEMARLNTDILGISKLKWIAMGEFNSDNNYI